MFWYEKGGSGTRAVLLLHGLGATSGVWAGVTRVLDQRRIGRWIAPDLGGHGRSVPQPLYSVGGLAAELASLVHDIAAVGHNAHVEKPEEVVELLERLIQR